jgi:hypothetical protein
MIMATRRNTIMTSHNPPQTISSKATKDMNRSITLYSGMKLIPIMLILEAWAWVLEQAPIYLFHFFHCRLIQLSWLRRCCVCHGCFGMRQICPTVSWCTVDNFPSSIHLILMDFICTSATGSMVGSWHSLSSG